MFNHFLVDTFRNVSMKEAHDRIKTFLEPDTDWNPFLMLDSGDHEKFFATELEPEHFKDASTIERMFSEYIPETLENLKADMAAFVKPVWIGKVEKGQDENEVNHFNQGILIIMAYPNELESWVAPIIRVNGKEPSLGKFAYYKMEFDDTGSWVKRAFQGILDPKPLIEGGEEKVDGPLD